MNDSLYFDSMRFLLTTIAFFLFIGLCIAIFVASTIPVFQPMSSPFGKLNRLRDVLESFFEPIYFICRLCINTQVYKAKRLTQ